MKTNTTNTMKATLIHNNGRQRFYRLSEPITKGCSDLGGECNIAENVTKLLPRLQMTDEEREAVARDYSCGCTLVGISDAHTHVERLAFPAIAVGGVYGILPDDIAGKHTMMIHGGDVRSIYNDATYLRYLCRLNGLKWEGIE